MLAALSLDQYCHFRRVCIVAVHVSDTALYASAVYELTLLFLHSAQALVLGRLMPPSSSTLLVLANDIVMEPADIGVEVIAPSGLTLDAGVLFVDAKARLMTTECSSRDSRRAPG